MEIPKNNLIPAENTSPLLAKEAVTTGTHLALETLMGALAPAATIGILAYGFKMMFRGVLGGSGAKQMIA